MQEMSQPELQAVEATKLRGSVTRQAAGAAFGHLMTWGGGLLTFARRKPLGAIGGVLVLFLVAVAIFGPWIAPYDPLKSKAEEMFLSPRATHVMGTDQFGRDILSRVIYGARISLYVSLVAVLFGDVLGFALGLVSGFMGGKVDAILQRFVDVVMSFPTLVLALAIIAVLGRSVNNVIIAIAIIELPRSTRVIRSAAISVKTNEYVGAARALGASNFRIMVRHVAPQCIAPWLILVSAALGAAIVIEASLSFLGLGTPPPEPSWGSMISGATIANAERAPWLAIFPGLALSATVFGFCLLGDALRDVLDPRLRKG